MSLNRSYRRGMTLPELLVVVAIIGLLAVTVLPSLSGTRQRSQAREAADLLVSHVSEVSARSIGAKHGASTWYETEETGAGGDHAVVQLGYGRVRTQVSGSTSVSATGAVSLPAVVAAFLPAPIHFVGSPSQCVATSVSQISSTASGLSALNRTVSNNAMPLATSPIPYLLDLPPRPRLTASARAMPNNMAIDFSWSSIGVDSFTEPSTKKLPLGSYKCLAITFDVTGRPTWVWVTAGHPASSPAAWNFVTLDAATPIVLLVGPRGNVGNAYVASPTEDNPGANWQNPDARWVLIDPRTSVVKSIETYAKATTVADSLRFVVQTLKNTFN